MTITAQANVECTNIVCIAEDLVKTRQALEYVNIFSGYLHRGGTHNVDPTKFRVTIKRDTYEFQSFARVEVWRADGWTYVYGIAGEDERVSDLPTYVCSDLVGARAQFGDLGSELIAVAIQVAA